MLNQSSSSSTKNYIDVCGEISECNSNAASQQRLLSGGTGSRQLKQEESIAAATSVCAIANDTPNMNTHDEVCLYFPTCFLLLVRCFVLSLNLTVAEAWIMCLSRKSRSFGLSNRVNL